MARHPAQVVAKDGRRSSKVVLHPRFQVAIDKAANRAGMREYNAYIGEWRKTQRAVRRRPRGRGHGRSRAARGRVHQAPPRGLIQSGGVAGGPALPPGDHIGDLTDMTDTVLSSATREVVIGFDRPFVIIGERINPTGRKLLAEEMKAGDFSRVERDALAQVEAGAHMLDVNAGIPLADEPAILAKTIQLVQSLTDLPLSIDSSIVEALEAGLAVYQGKPLRQLGHRRGGAPRARPAARQASTARRSSRSPTTRPASAMDPDVRFAVAKRIVERAADHGIPRSDIVVDPLVMPIGALAQAGQQVFALVRRLREELKVNTTCGASNVSFGLPNREGINAAFLPMAIAAGMTSAITNPLMPEVKACVMAADVLMGHDPDCGRWITAQPRPDPGGRGQPPPGQSPRRPPSASEVPSRGRRRARHLHAVGPARPVPGGHDGPRRRALARRRHRLGLRRARHLRPLPGDAGPRRVRQARDHVRSRTTCRRSPRSRRPTATRRASPPTAACRARPTVCGDVVIDVPPESQVHRQVVRKGLDVRDVHRRPGRPAPLRRGHAARARVADRRPRPAVRGARARVAADRSRGGPRRSSATSSRRSRRASTASPSRSTTGAQVIGVWPGFHETAYGVAIDVGSTTIAGHLADLADGAVLASTA